MTDPENTPAAPSVRRRNGPDSRQRLLKAASELFAERGYKATTVREVGLRARVDPALIARYFGGKSGMYLETLRRDGQPISLEPLNITDPAELSALLDRVTSGGPTPTMDAAVRPHADAEVQEAAVRVLRKRVLEPAEQSAALAGFDDAVLRGELITAALAGVVLSRASGAMPALAAASAPEVGQLLAQLIMSLVKPSS